MSRLRVANCSGSLGSVYQELKKNSELIYQEGSLADNISRLIVGKVDAALISTADFALHGGCIGLDYGVAFSSEHSPQIVLHSKGALEDLQAVYVKESAESVWLLLKILLSEVHHATPRLMYLIRQKNYDDLRDGEGILTIGSDNFLQQGDNTGVVVNDLATMWSKWQELPFTALVWVIRQETIKKEDRKTLLNALASCADKYNREIITKFNEDVITGLNKFYELCSEKDFLPKTTYKNLTQEVCNISGKNKKQINIENLLQDTLAGQRLSVNDAVNIAKFANFEDLILTANILRSRLFSKFSVRTVYTLKAKKIKDFEAQIKDEDFEIPKSVSSLIISPAFKGKVALESYEKLLQQIKERFHLPIEGIDIPTIFSLSQSQSLTVEQTASRLVSAGLDGVSGAGGEILLDEKITNKKGGSFVAEWLRVVKWLHRFGAKTSCCIRVAKKDTWEERLLHLQKLRALQDLNSGFSHFYFVTDPLWQGQEFVDTYLRLVAIVRLFFDNLASIYLDYFEKNGALCTLALNAGANEIKVDLSENQCELIDFELF